MVKDWLSIWPTAEKDVPPSSRSGDTERLVIGSAIHVLFTQILGTFNAFSKCWGTLRSLKNRHLSKWISSYSILGTWSITNVPGVHPKTRLLLHLWPGLHVGPWHLLIKGWFWFKNYTSWKSDLTIYKIFKIGTSSRTVYYSNLKNIFN